jgi:hypothetical protein
MTVALIGVVVLILGFAIMTAGVVAINSVLWYDEGTWLFWGGLVLVAGGGLTTLLSL